MFNLKSSIDALRDAETIIASKLLSSDEQTNLLRELVASIPEKYAGLHASLVHSAICRRLPQPAKEQGRKAEGKQDEAVVAEGGPEASEGEAEGVEEPTQDFGSVPSRKDPGGAPGAEAKAPAEPKVRRTGKAPRS